MTTKILTIRVPAPVYSELCTNAAELGVPVSAHVRRLIEQGHQAQQVTQLRVEVLDRLNTLTSTAPQTAAPSPALAEILLLARATAAHLNPQLVAQVRAKLATQLAGASA
jgi:predicted DNA-binding ribbon-helix-helix protein